MWSVRHPLTGVTQSKAKKFGGKLPAAWGSAERNHPLSRAAGNFCQPLTTAAGSVMHKFGQKSISCPGQHGVIMPVDWGSA